MPLRRRLPFLGGFGSQGKAKAAAKGNAKPEEPTAGKDKKPEAGKDEGGKNLEKQTPDEGEDEKKPEAGKDESGEKEPEAGKDEGGKNLEKQTLDAGEGEKKLEAGKAEGEGKPAAEASTKPSPKTAEDRFIHVLLPHASLNRVVNVLTTFWTMFGPIANGSPIV